MSEIGLYLRGYVRCRVGSSEKPAEGGMSHGHVRCRVGSSEIHAERTRVPETVRCRSEERTSELQSLLRISYAVFCLKKKKNKTYTLQPSQLNHNDHQSN